MVTELRGRGKTGLPGAYSTVKVHVKHVLQKLNLRNRFEAAVWLRELRELREEERSG